MGHFIKLYSLHFLAVLCTVGVIRKYETKYVFFLIFKREVCLYLSKIFWTFIISYILFSELWDLLIDISQSCIQFFLLMYSLNWYIRIFDINIYITTPQQFTLLHITIDAVKIVVASGKKGKSTHNAPV